MKKLFTLLTLALLSIGTAWADAVTIGLTQSNDNTPVTVSETNYLGTIAAAVYDGTTNVTVAEAHGAGCGINQSGRKTTGTDGNYYATKCFRKTINSSTWDATEWIGYTMTVASGYKVSLTNIKATLWDANSNATYTWRVVIENAGGTALYTSENKTSSTSSIGTLSDASPDGLSGLTAGTYTVKLQLYQAGGNKYFTIPYLTVDATVEEDNSTVYTVTASADPAAGGSIAGGGEWVEGSDVTLTATPNEGYKFVSWEIDGTGGITENPYIISDIKANHTAVANFEKLYTVTYDLSTYKGSVNRVLNNYLAPYGINEKYANASNKYTIPTYAHRYLYNEGHVLTGWTDGANTYKTGDEITLTGDITLTPVWTATTASLKDSKALSVVTWKFGISDMLFNGWQSSGATGYYTKPQTVNGELIAVPMIVDATSGKVDNSTRTDALAQVNNGTKFTIPAIKGMTVVLYANSNITNTTVAGNTPSSGSGSKTATYNYTGEDGTADIVIADGSYYEKIVVTYPVTAANVTIAPTKEYTTYIAPAALDFTGLDIKAYVATEATASAITVEEVTTVPAGTALILKKGTAASYDVPVIASATAPAKNLLKGSATASYNVENDGDAYVLSDGAFHPVNKGKLAAGKAYILKADVPVPAPELSIVFGNLTGIQNITTAVKQSEGVVFDLQGRKVAQPAKGLYIVNGKKVIIK